MDRVEIAGLQRPVSRIGFGTWSVGGGAWAATAEAVRTVHAALDRGVNLVDTAPGHDLGRAEEIVGRALSTWHGQPPMVATTLASDARGTARAPGRVRAEVEASLRRLGVETIDLCHVGRIDEPDRVEPIGDALSALVGEGKVRAVGARGLSAARLDALAARVPLAAVSAPYDLLERGIEDTLLPHCRARALPVIAYGALCRGLLSGRLSPATTFEGDELRRADPKFRAPSYHAYLAVAAALDAYAREAFGRTVLDLALRWVLDQPGVAVVLWSARLPSQLDPVAGASGWRLGADAQGRVEEIVRVHVGPPGGEAPAAAPRRRESA